MSQPLSHKAALLRNGPPILISTPSKVQQDSFRNSGLHNSQLSNAYLKRSVETNQERDLREIQQRFANEAQEIQKSYHNNYERHLKMGRTIQELESLLDEERRKYLLLEDRYDGLLREYDSERRLRIDFDHDIGSLKEELRKKDIVLSDLDLQLSRLQQENTYLNTENNSLRSEIARLNDMYHLKINEIEERNTNQVRDLNSMIENMRSTIEQQTIENNNQIRDINREWEAKLYRLDDRLRERDRDVLELEANVRTLNDHNSRLKVECEEEIRRQSGLAREDERTRWQLVIKDLEAQVRMLLDERDVANKRNSDLVRDCSVKERQQQDLKINHEIEISRLCGEINDLRNQCNHLSSQVDKHKNEILNKDTSLSRLENELHSANRDNDRSKEEHQAHLNRTANEHTAEVRRWEDRERELRNRLADCERLLKIAEDNENRIRFEYDRLREQITGNVNKIISQTFLDHHDARAGRKLLL